VRYLSVCSGIEAATVAWHGLGWTPVAFSEIEPFPSAVLQHHYPHVPNLGDMTNFKEWNLGTVDLLVGGTPCQSFSVAGLRKGLEDPRGNLMLTYLAIAQRYRPRWLVWENVPGVLSSNGGRDFGTFLGALGELGYGWAYRVLDAQWFGVAQRRRRVFVVGCLGDQASAAKVLFESESVCRNPPPSREKGQGSARGVGGGVERRRWPAEITSTLNAAFGEKQGLEDQHALNGAELFVPVPLFATSGQTNAAFAENQALALNATNEAPYVAQPVAGSHWDSPANPHPTLNQSHNTGGIAASDQELFSQRGSGLVAQPVAFHHNAQASQLPTDARDTSIGDSLTVSQQAAVALPVAFKVRGGVEVDSAGKTAGKGYLGSEETAFTLAATQDQWIGQPVAMRDVAQALTSNYGKQPDNSDTALGPNVVMQPGSSVNASGPTVMQPVAFPIDTQNMTEGHASGGLGFGQENDPSFTLTKGHSHAVAVAQPVAYGIDGEQNCSEELIGTLRSHQSGGYEGARVAQPVAPALTASNDPSRSPQSSEVTQQVSAVHATTMQVRRLTPVECERLQGFPDGWTNIPWRKKDEAPDGPRYKALGNSMAVPCMRWIGERIQAATARQEVQP